MEKPLRRFVLWLLCSFICLQAEAGVSIGVKKNRLYVMYDGKEPEPLTVALLERSVRKSSEVQKALMNYLGTTAAGLAQIDDRLAVGNPEEHLSPRSLAKAAHDMGVPYHFSNAFDLHGISKPTLPPAVLTTLYPRDSGPQRKGRFRFQTHYNVHGNPVEQVYFEANDSWTLLSGETWKGVLREHKTELLQFLNLPAHSTFLEDHQQSIEESGLLRFYAYRSPYIDNKDEFVCHGEENVFVIFTKAIANSIPILNTLSRNNDHNILSQESFEHEDTGEIRMSTHESELESWVHERYVSLAGYGEFNQHMRQQNAYSHVAHALNNVYVKYLKKIPDFEGPVLRRAVYLNPAQMEAMGKLKAGDHVTDLGFISTTDNDKVDGRFGDFQIEFHKPAHAKSFIDAKNILGGDAEILFLPFSTFQVESVDLQKRRLTLRQTQRDVKTPYQDMIKNTGE